MNSVHGSAPRSLADVDWAAWVPDDVATLLFVREREQVLLIRKKRGLGAGKINAPGGRLEPGETPLQAAIREVQEEVCVTPLAPADHGVLRFQFCDGYKLQAHVFVSFGHVGVPRATVEADPFFCALDQLPFDEMWADDALWLPHVLAGKRVDGRFIFDGELMLDHALSVADSSS
jgi:8-oxo-dGTP diphosphatase